MVSQLSLEKREDMCQLEYLIFARFRAASGDQVDLSLAKPKS